MLKNKLKNAQGIIDLPRHSSKERVEQVCEHNENIYQKIIAEHFDGRNVSCHIGPSSFWVYANTLDECKHVKELARSYGYKNMRTFRPHTTDGNGQQIDDPDGLYVVDINSLGELVIGDPAKKFIKLLEPFITAAEEKIMYVYAHLGRVNLKFNDPDAAKELKKSLDQVFSYTENKIENFKADIEFYKEDSSFDVWVVHIHIKAL